ncbi:uncharacterized protein LOC126088405 [Schistocerca cancellata]|uniref:uncharacterized protein LOC126088405 n=1 Tax=Schistocerca cancellata TaxID=274614 RepID=UPI002118F0D4|nr:uncharacterized protein LOC126088405 [Schistocerca cancellata]
MALAAQHLCTAAVSVSQFAVAYGAPSRSLTLVACRDSVDVNRQARRQTAGLANGRAAPLSRVRRPREPASPSSGSPCCAGSASPRCFSQPSPSTWRRRSGPRGRRPRLLPPTTQRAACGVAEARLELLDIRRRPPTRLLGARLRMPCSCQDLTCGCCVGMRIQAFSFDRTACMNLTYDPYEFALVADVLMDGDSLYQQTMSAKNPPPLCMPVPIPYAPSMDMCMRLWDVYTPGLNLHACLDMEARLQRAPVLVLHFDCMVMGRDGVALVKPGEEGLPPVDEPTAGGGGDDIYDEVTEDRKQASAATAPPVP